MIRLARSRCLTVVVACLVLAGLLRVSAQSDVPGGAETVIDVAHPGRIEARRLARLAGEALTEGDAAGALALYELAITEDPLLLEAWVNRTAAAVRACRPATARASAAVARQLGPQSRAAAVNHRLAGRLECPDSPEEGALARIEAGLFERPNDPGAWSRAAAARREAGAALLAAFYESRGIALGGGVDLRASGRLARDLAQAGLLRSALDVVRQAVGGAGEPDWVAMAEAKLADIEAKARDLGALAARRVPGGTAETGSRLARIAEVLLARGGTVEQVGAELTRLVDDLATQVVERPWGRLRLGPLWRVVSPPAGAPWPDLVLRRFPSDTQLAFYPWPGDLPADAPPDALARRLQGLAAVSDAPWVSCEQEAARDEPQATGCRRAEIEGVLGGQGRATLTVWLLEAANAGRRVVAVSLAGDAGCGPGCLDEARRAIREVMAKFAPGEAGFPEGASWHVPVPPGWNAVREHDERVDPWRSVPLGAGLAVDLPPGVTSRPMDGPFPEPGGSPATALWFRGEFVDRVGVRVRIGSPDWAGWIDVTGAEQEPIERWLARRDELVLPQDPGARAVGAAPLGPAIEKAYMTGSGGVVRFRGERFDGDWLWIRRVLGELQVDIHVPVARGGQSLSLLWMGLTVRPLGGESPPAIVDLSSRFEVRFERFDGRRSRNDPREGVLLADALEVAVPRGFRVTISGMSRDGFPVKARNDAGSRMEIARFAPAPGASPRVRLRELGARFGVDGNSQWERGRSGREEQAWIVIDERDGRERCVIGLLPDDSARPAFALALTRGPQASRASWKTSCRLLEDARFRHR